MSETKHDRRGFLRTAAAASATVGAAALAMPAATSAAGSAAGPVPVRTLGRTGERLPIIQLGTSQRLNPKYDKVMHRCFKAGVNGFDTALSYGWGSSHKAIANFITQIEDRRQLWLTSKSGSGSVEGLEKGMDKALAELQADYLDLYLMHGIRNVRMLDREYLALGERLKRSGKTRFFGFSCHDGNVVELLETAAERGGIDAILFRYNFRRYGDRALNVAIDRAHKAGIGLLAMKTMGSVPSDIERVVDFRSRDFTLAQAKLKSVWGDERITTIVSEMDSVRVVRENIGAAKSEKSLTAEESHQLNQLAALTAGHACNGCSHLCEAAAGGDLAIAAPLRYLMYHECYGKPDRARALYGGLPPASLACDDGALERAAAVCPQGIDIAARLAQARRVLQG